MTDWVYAPQMVWSVWALIDGVRRGVIGPIGVLVYVLIFSFLLVGTRAYCRQIDEREAREARRQREREEALLERELKHIRARIVRNLFKSGAIRLAQTLPQTGLHFGEEGDTFDGLGESDRERVRAQKVKP